MKKTELQKFKKCYEKSGKGYKIIKQYTFPKLDYDFPDMESDNCEILNGYLTLFVEFWWNGATKFPDIESIMRASAGHDGIFDLIIKYMKDSKVPKKLVKLANKQLYKWCREDGMNLCLAKIIYRAVRIFGGNTIKKYYKKKQKKEIKK